MQHPDPGGTGARDRNDADASLAGDAPVSNKSRAPIQARPRRARFARSMVFQEFRYRDARALDYDHFVDRKPGQTPRTWGAST